MSPVDRVNDSAHLEGLFSPNRPARASHSSSEYHGLNCDDSERGAEARALLEAWFGHYPNECKADLRGRFRSKTNNTHRAALWELVLWGHLWAAGLKVSIPQKAERTTTPDFKVATDRGTYYIEATSVTDDLLDPGQKARLEGVTAAMTTIRSHSHWFSISVTALGKQSVKKAVIIREVGRLLDSLRFGTTPHPIGFQRMSCIAVDDWKIEVSVLPRTASGTAESAFAGINASGISFENASKVRQRLVEKAGNYAVDAPLIIAIAQNGLFFDDFAITNALYGTSVLEVPIDCDVEAASSRRKADGFFATDGASIPIVIAANDVSAYSAGSVQSKQWLNPMHQTASIELPFPFGLSELGQRPTP